MFYETTLLISAGQAVGNPISDENSGLLRRYINEWLDPGDFNNMASAMYFWTMDTYQLEQVTFEALLLKESASQSELESQVPSYEYHRTSLGNIISLLKMQMDGEKGFLLTSGKRNIFYVASVVHGIYTISVVWNMHEWQIERKRGYRDLEQGDQIVVLAAEFVKKHEIETEMKASSEAQRRVEEFEARRAANIVAIKKQRIEQVFRLQENLEKRVAEMQHEIERAKARLETVESDLEAEHQRLVTWLRKHQSQLAELTSGS